MFLDKSKTIFSDLISCLLIGKKSLQLRREFLSVVHQNGSSFRYQTAGDFKEVKHMRSKEDTLFKEEGFKGIVAAYWDEASADEDECPEAIKPHQFTHGIEEDHAGDLLSVLTGKGRPSLP